MPPKPRRKRSFGGLRRLPSKRYQANYTAPDGVIYNAPTTFDTSEDAEAWLADERRRISAGTWVPPSQRSPSAQTITFREYADAWLPNRRTRKGELLRPRTAEHYRDLLERLIYPTFEDLVLSAITPELVELWWDRMGSDRPTYRAHAYGLLRTIMESARTDRFTPVTINPCAIDHAGRVDRKIRVVPATLDELAVIAQEMPAELRLAVLLSAWCALRFGEMAELRRKDVALRPADRKNPSAPRLATLKIRRGVVRVGGEAIIGKPKTSAGDRDVAVPPHLVPAIEAHLREHVESGPESLVFPAKGGGNLAPSTLYRPYYRARKAAGREDLRWHDLRHSGAVLAAQTGATLKELMGRLGHSSPAAAMRYQHIGQGRDAEIAALLSKMAGAE